MGYGAGSVSDLNLGEGLLYRSSGRWRSPHQAERLQRKIDTARPGH